jgi:hypothetical protein
LTSDLKAAPEKLTFEIIDAIFRLDSRQLNELASRVFHHIVWGFGKKAPKRIKETVL